MKNPTKCPVCKTVFEGDPEWFLRRQVYCTVRCRNVAQRRTERARKKARKAATAIPA